MTDKAILAVFTDARSVKSRSIMQLVLEVPIEEADKALKALGGWPLPSESRWVGVALSPKDRKEAEAKEKRERVPFGELSLSAQAALRCNDAEFQKFLYQNVKTKYDAPMETDFSIIAAGIVRDVCNVKSRSELNTDERAASHWRVLDNQFRQWQTDRRYESSRTR